MAANTDFVLLQRRWCIAHESLLFQFHTIWTVLFLGHLGAIRLLLAQNKLDIDAKNIFGFTPLMKAAIQGHIRCAKTLLFAGEWCNFIAENALFSWISNCWFWHVIFGFPQARRPLKLTTNGNWRQNNGLDFVADTRAPNSLRNGQRHAISTKELCVNRRIRMAITWVACAPVQPYKHYRKCHRWRAKEVI